MEREIIIRKFQEDDAESVYQVLKYSWLDAYSSFIPKEDLESYLNQTYSVELLKKICTNADYISFVAEMNDTICGWLKLCDSKIENRFYINSIYVLPEFQQLKIGSRLIVLSLEEARKKNYSEIFIGVMLNNEKALRWYRNLGFEFFEESPFTMGKISVPHLIGKKKLVK